MKKEFFLLIFLFVSNLTFCQVFITLDNDTHEFIEDVNFTLYKKGIVIHKNTTLSNEATKINEHIEYDSINFSRIDYNTLSFSKDKIDTLIYLTKKTIYLDEVVVVTNKDNEMILGEKNRFIQSQNRSLSNDLIYGTIFKNNLSTNLDLKKAVFFVDKVTYKTSYKINFFRVEETVPIMGKQFAEIGELIYSSDTLCLLPKHKNKVEVELNPKLSFKKNTSIFVFIELLNYYDEKNNIIKPTFKESTKLKFQISDQTNFYSKMSHYETGELTKDLVNINRMINYDFANILFKKPHKSTIVTPAVLLYTDKLGD